MKKITQTFFFFAWFLCWLLACTESIHADAPGKTAHLAAQAVSLGLPPPRQGGVYVIAHRGAHLDRPENTLAAYRHAIELGCDFVEVDLRETADGHIVSVHNATLDDYTRDATGPVKQFTLEQIKQLDIGSRVGPQWKDERIPELEEILALCSGKIGLYIDLKAADPCKVAEALRRYGMEKQAVWYAGPGSLKSLKECCPECHPMPDPLSPRGLERLLGGDPPPVIATDFQTVTPEMIRQCHTADVMVFVDDGGPGSWPALLEMGADGIQTDDPAGLIELLRQRNAPAEPRN
ncbi:MAG TPA: glycerophosphodiester phosphodiesterase family protein [Candidatus Hydrogenedentes bacterium]|nr:glycerophosphodiester phosphodiesterase family protein [Candidatus Hydrogenedentota bacterium]HPU97572.1 glycerophosphodiester phosphodiesterase family protein [Candidatus Hydrogenedentota bacterium]